MSSDKSANALEVGSKEGDVWHYAGIDYSMRLVQSIYVVRCVRTEKGLFPPGPTAHLVRRSDDTWVKKGKDVDGAPVFGWADKIAEHNRESWPVGKPHPGFARTEAAALKLVVKELEGRIKIAMRLHAKLNALDVSRTEVKASKSSVLRVSRKSPVTSEDVGRVVYYESTAVIAREGKKRAGKLVSLDGKTCKIDVG